MELVKMKSDKYFFVMSVILYFIMLIGFAHSFFFRHLLHRGPLPPVFIIHSILNVAWYTALISQAWLAMNNKIINHKRNGIYWFVLSIAVVTFNSFIIYTTAHKQTDSPQQQMDILGMVTGNSFNTVLFICYVGLSYFFRHRPDIHKRLLLVASIAPLTVALDRFQRYDLLRFAAPEMNMLIYNILIPQVLYFSILGYDLVTRKRPHFITVTLLAMNFVLMFLFYLAFATGLGARFVEFLKNH